MRERLLKLKRRAKSYWDGNDLRISKQLSGSMLNDVRINWKLGNKVNLINQEK